jgi:2-polyprenyl-3-methyl-5-hydroxy-6-metoxy-1,4-benzoquinol methylase
MNYDSFHKHTNSQNKIISNRNYTYKFLIEALSKFDYKEKKILDIGCGSGAIDFYLTKNGASVLGIDISKKAIETCITSSNVLGLQQNLSFKVIDFPKNTINQKFDIIICSEVLEHLADDKLAIRQISKMLKSNGVFIVSVPSKNAPLFRWGFAADFDKEVGHLRRYSENDLIKLFAANGLTIISSRKIEGLLRNYLFLNRRAGKIIRFLRSYISDFVTILDKLLIPVFGESNILMVVRKT